MQKGSWKFDFRLLSEPNFKDSNPSIRDYLSKFFGGHTKCTPLTERHNTFRIHGQCIHEIVRYLYQSAITLSCHVYKSESRGAWVGPGPGMPLTVTHGNQRPNIDPSFPEHSPALPAPKSSENQTSTLPPPNTWVLQTPDICLRSRLDILSCMPENTITITISYKQTRRVRTIFSLMKCHNEMKKVPFDLISLKTSKKKTFFSPFVLSLSIIY